MTTSGQHAPVLGQGQHHGRTRLPAQRPAQGAQTDAHLRVHLQDCTRSCKPGRRPRVCILRARERSRKGEDLRQRPLASRIRRLIAADSGHTPPREDVARKSLTHARQGACVRELSTRRLCAVDGLAVGRLTRTRREHARDLVRRLGGAVRRGNADARRGGRIGLRSLGWTPPLGARGGS